mmetsp:Transcript_7818/g.14807  ORF Transcript_7818/g.14807 Transcript_7818/m.14807 type:complete len:398 (-) Transcript_7818:398-1591(-)
MNSSGHASNRQVVLLLVPIQKIPHLGSGLVIRALTVAFLGRLRRQRRLLRAALLHLLWEDVLHEAAQRHRHHQRSLPGKPGAAAGARGGGVRLPTPLHDAPLAEGVTAPRGGDGIEHDVVTDGALQLLADGRVLSGWAIARRACRARLALVSLIDIRHGCGHAEKLRAQRGPDFNHNRLQRREVQFVPLHARVVWGGGRWGGVLRAAQRLEDALAVPGELRRDERGQPGVPAQTHAHHRVRQRARHPPVAVQKGMHPAHLEEHVGDEARRVGVRPLQIHRLTHVLHQARDVLRARRHVRSRRQLHLHLAVAVEPWGHVWLHVGGAQPMQRQQHRGPQHKGGALRVAAQPARNHRYELCQLAKGSSLLGHYAWLSTAARILNRIRCSGETFLWHHRTT